MIHQGLLRCTTVLRETNPSTTEGRLMPALREILGTTSSAGCYSEGSSMAGTPFFARPRATA